MSIYIYKNNQQTGPFSEVAVLEMLKNGRLSPNDSAVRQGQSQWQTLRILFPDAASAAGGQPLPPLDNQIQSPPKKSGYSKGLLFGLLGIGGFFVLAVIGLAGLYYWSASKNDSTGKQGSNANSNASTSAAASSSSNYSQADFKAINNKSEEFARMSPPPKIETDPVIKGKVVIVQKDQNSARTLGLDYNANKYHPAGISEYGIAPARLAIRPEEIDTLIQILCGKGKFLGRYQGGVSAYASDCKVSIIDYKTPAVIAQKSFANNALPKTVSSAYAGGDFITLPSREVSEYVGNFPLDKLANPTSGMPLDDNKGTYGKYTPFMDMAGELSRVAFPVKIDSNAAIKGKIAYAVKEASGRAALKGFDAYGKEISTYDAQQWGVSKDKIAEKPEEIDTLIQVNCKKGTRLGAVKGTIVYSNQCQVSIVDYKASTTIFQKTFENKEMNRDIDTEIYPTEHTVSDPYFEIYDFIKGFPKS